MTDSLCETINVGDIVILISILFFFFNYIIKCGIEIGTNILVVTIDSA